MAKVRASRRTVPRFSVVTIVRDEAEGLPRLLDSLSEFRERGGEVLVLDTGSRDGTPEIAKAAGCRVFVEPRRFSRRLKAAEARRANRAFCREGEGPFFEAGERIFNFGAARAHAAGLARNHVQVVVDGTDTIDQMDVTALDAIARSGRLSLMGFETRIRIRTGWLAEPRAGLFDRRRAEWRGQAHNFLAPRSAGSGEPPVLSVLPPTTLSLSHHTNLQKTRGHQLAGLALEALADPGSERWRYLLGRDLAGRGGHRSALPLLLSLDGPPCRAELRSAALCLAARSLAAIGGPAEDVDALFFRAARRDPKRRDPFLQLASRRLLSGEMQAAVCLATAALEIPPGPGLAEPASNHSFGPHAILYWALLWLGRRAEARVHFERCRELDPGNPVYAEHEKLLAVQDAQTPGPPPVPSPPRPRSARRGRPSFSVVSILRNERLRLPLLLESLEEFRERGGEILVLDTGSDDGTPELARKWGCKVVVEPRRFNRRLKRSEAERIQERFSKGGEGPFLSPGDRLFNFGAARNHAASLARHDFQLAVDGSDIVGSLDIDAVDRQVRSGAFDMLLFETRRRAGLQWFLEARDYFHDRRAFQWSGRAHNFAVPRQRGAVPRQAFLPRETLRVVHHTDPTKARAYQLGGIALDLLEKSHPLRRHLVLGAELASRGHLQSALAALLTVDDPRVTPHFRSAALVMAARCLADLRKGSEDEIGEMLFRASTQDPGRRDPLLCLAQRSMAAGDLQGAVSLATAALAIPPRVDLTEPEQNHGTRPHAILYWALLWTGRREDARRHFRRCRELDPENPLYRDHERLFVTP